MSKKAIYCVRQFWRVGGIIEGGPIEQFASEDGARSHGVEVSKAAQGVAVFRLEGDPAADHWDEVTLITRFGCAPPGCGLRTAAL